MKRVLHSLKRLSQRPEARHVGTLMSGSMAAQVALVATAPLLARLFPPGAFGLFSLMLTISTIGGAVGGLCYEVAVILPRSVRMARALYRLAFFLSLVTPFVMVGLVAFLQYLFPHLLGRTLTTSFYVYCLLATALTTQVNVLCYGHSRAAQYGAISMNKVTQALLPAVAQIGLALVGLVGEGLMLGRDLGLLGSGLWLTRRLPHGFRLRVLLCSRWLSLSFAVLSFRVFLVLV